VRVGKTAARRARTTGSQTSSFSLLHCVRPSPSWSRSRLKRVRRSATLAESNCNTTAHSLETYGEMLLQRTVVVGGIAVDTSSFDFNDRSSRVTAIETTNITLIILVGCFVGLRLFVRVFMVRKIFLDDSMWPPRSPHCGARSDNACSFDTACECTDHRAGFRMHCR